jgi:hypothetical protein
MAHFLVVLILAALLLPATGMAGPSAPVIIGSAEIHRFQGSSMLVGAVFPIAIYDGVQFRKAAVTADEEHKLRRLLPQSILNRIRQFDLHLEGERIASLRLRQVEATPGCPPEVGGFGQVRSARPLDFSKAIESNLHVNAQGDIDPTGTREREGFRYVATRMLDVDAVSGLSGQNQEFASRTQALNPPVLASLKALGKYEIQAAVRRNWRDVGRVVLRGEVLLEGWKAFDLNRDGIREMIVGFKAPLVRPRRSSDPGQPPPALVLMMVASIPAQGQQQLLLSLPTLIGVDNASEMYDLSSVLDLTGDGVAELVLYHIYAPEFSGYEIFSIKEGVFRRVFSGDVTGC